MTLQLPAGGGFDFRLPADPASAQSTLDQLPQTPVAVKVRKVADTHIEIGVSDTIQVPGRMKTAAYRVYFGQLSTATMQIVSDPVYALQVFKASTYVAMIPATGRGGTVTVWDSQYYGLQGWFFAVGVAQNGQESLPTPPCPSPFNDASAGGTGTPNPAFPTDTIPHDVTNPQLSIAPARKPNTQGTVCLLTVSAEIPLSLTVFNGYQLYIKNYRNTGHIFEWLTVSRGTQEAGTLTAQFYIEPDIYVPYPGNPYPSASSFATVTGAFNLKRIGTGHWDVKWGPNQYISVLDATLGMQTFQINSVTDADNLTTVMSTSSLTAGNQPYVIYTPEGQPLASVPHAVRIYFVSISNNGVRREDIENSPYVELPFGLGAALTAPLNPTSLNISVTSVGTTLQLDWQANTVDPALASFNIYRAREGTFSNFATAGRPTNTYATKVYDRTMGLGSKQTFVDRAFDNDPTSLTFDFNDTNPGQYRYWVTAVNVDGQENPLSYSGSCTSNGAGTLTRTGGNQFVQIMNGETMVIDPTPGTPGTVSAVNFVAQTCGFSGFASAGAHIWTVGPTAEHALLIDQSDAGDGWYKDMNFNRLFNTQFFIERRSYSNLPSPIAMDYNTQYLGTTFFTDYQPSFRYFYSSGALLNHLVLKEYIESPAYFGGNEPGYYQMPGAVLEPPTLPTKQNDSWSPWYFLRDVIGTNAPQIGVMATDPNQGNGLVIFPNFTGSHYQILWQQVVKSKFLLGEWLTMSFDIGVNDTAAPTSGVFRCQMIRFDCRDWPAPYGLAGAAMTGGTERDLAGADFSATKFGFLGADGTMSFKRLTMKGKLPGDPTLIVNTTAGSAVVNVTSGTVPLGLNWRGCQLNGVATSTLSNRIVDTTASTITMRGLATSTVTGVTVTVGVDAETTHYAFKLGIIASVVSPGGVKEVWLGKIMVNGGRKASDWTPVLLSMDMGQESSSGGDGITPVACVPYGTLVLMSNGAEKPIEAIQEGERVVGCISSNAVPVVVEKVIRSTAREFFTIYAASGERITCTRTHRLAIKGAANKLWREAQAIKIDDEVYLYSAGMVVQSPVVAITTALEDESTPICTFTVNGSHNYFASNFLSHNKAEDQLP